MGNDVGVLLKESGMLYLNGLLSTIVLSLVGTFGGFFLGVFLAFGKRLPVEGKSKGQKAWRYPVRFLCSAYSLIIRGTPMMVQAMIFKYATSNADWSWNEIRGINTWNGWLLCGMIVITFNTAAYMCEDLLSGLNGVDKGQTEGAKSLGMSDFSTLLHVTLPQAIRNAIPTFGNEWIVNIKDSSVLNVIGTAELYFEATSAASQNYKIMASFVLIAIIYLCLTLAATGILKLVERKLDGKKFAFSFRNLLFHGQSPLKEAK
ncbi:MAG: amino acid ABC transporter permease [Bacilli bacterium]